MANKIVKYTIFVLVGLLVGTALVGAKTFTLDNISWNLTDISKPQLLVSCIKSTTDLPIVEDLAVKLELNKIEIPMIMSAGQNNKKELCHFMCSCNLWKSIRGLGDNAEKLTGKAVTSLAVTYPDDFNSADNVLHIDGGSVKFVSSSEELKAKSAPISLVFAEDAKNCTKSTGVPVISPFYESDTGVPGCDKDIFKDTYTQKSQRGVGLFREPTEMTYAAVEAAKKAKDENKLTEFSVQCSGSPVAQFVTKFAIAVAALSAVARFGL